jgi:renalase
MSISEHSGTIIIGAGMAGLACARRLAQSGMSATVLDKGRGIGGRMATRRVTLDTQEIRFDHGAQFFTVKDAGFARMLDDLPDAAALWDDGAATPHLVGQPGMSALPRRMGEGLSVQQQAEVTGLEKSENGWTITSADQRTHHAAQIVLTIPAPQAARLLGTDHPLSGVLRDVEMAPCLTLMAAFAADVPRPFVNRSDPDHPLAWIAQDSSKPDRSGDVTTWVAQASPAWSAQYLEDTPEQITARMLPLLAEKLGISAKDALYAASHRWRYARVTKSLGQPFLHSGSDALYLGGDWCLGPRVEAAWQSGDAIARDIIKARDAG